MDEYILPLYMYKTVYSNNLSLGKHPVHRPTQICGPEAQVMRSLYHCAFWESVVRHIDIEVTCSFCNCNKKKTSLQLLSGVCEQ